MKYFKNIILIIIASVCLYNQIYAQADFIRRDAIGFAEISLNRSDAGINWLLTQWLQSPRPNALKSYTKNFRPEDATIAIFRSPQTGELRFAVISRTNISLESDKNKNIISQFIKNEITAPEFSNISYNQHIIYYGPMADRRYELGYFITGNRLIWGNELSLVKSVSDAISGENRLIRFSDYPSLRKRIPEKSDLVVYLNNNQSRFANVLSQQEKKWRLSLLLSAEDIASIIMGIDFIDGNKITGKIIFKSRNAAALAEIRNDANFLGETIRRKFSQIKIGYNRKVMTEGNYVTLEFEMTGVKPLFQEMFKEGITSLF